MNYSTAQLLLPQLKRIQVLITVVYDCFIATCRCHVHRVDVKYQIAQLQIEMLDGLLVFTPFRLGLGPGHQFRE